MWPYIAVAGVLTIMFWLSKEARFESLTRFGSLALLIVFIGLRYQLGYDWIAYERFFEFIPRGLGWSSYELSRAILPTEPAYYYLNVIIKELGGSFELLLFIMTAFNLIVIDNMAKRIAPGSQVFLWIFYFCLAALAVQFNILRQAVASSFVILSLLSVADQRGVRAVIYLALGSLFHVSVLMFVPVFLAFFYRISPRVLGGFIVVLLVVFVSGAFLGGALIGTVGGVLPEFLGSKADNYTDSFAGGQLSGVSPLSVVLILVYFGYLKIMVPRNRDLFTNVAIYLTLLVLAAHLGVSQFPSLWNRIMCVSLPWQLAALWRVGYLQEMTEFQIRKSVLFGAQVTAVLVMAYQLRQPQSVPFVPYHSVLQVELLGEEGDGRTRALYTIDQAQRQPS